MKYIEKKIWDDYLLQHLEMAREFIKDIPCEPNKGVQFEVLVECLLKYMFCDDELLFHNTKLSHDGSKDFWAIDNANEVWWAECKNYTPNIALTQLAPTLVMAEINQVRHLMFFSYSPLNMNLKKRIAQYSYKYHKEIFLYDDEVLEQLVFSYGEKTLRDKYNLASLAREEMLEIAFFNQINASVVNQHAFDENYEIRELNVGSIYNLNAILINRHYDTQIKVKVTIASSKVNQYFDFLNENLNRLSEVHEDEFTLLPHQIMLIKYSVLAKKESTKINLPRILVTYVKDGKLQTKKSTENKSYVCNWNKRVVLIGAHYERIINNFSAMCQKNLCALLVYGSGGTGKTRILEECKTKLIKKNYNIINFIGFDREASWKDIVLEISYQVFGMDKDMASSISCEIDDIISPDIMEPLKIKMISFLRLLKKEQSIENLEEYYEIIFSEMRKNKYAIIIDNLQSYSSEIIIFLKKMLQFLGAHIRRKNSFALLISLNTTLIYDKEYLDFIAAFQTLPGSGSNVCFECENVNGFAKEEQALAYLKTLLCLDEYPLNYKYLKEILVKSSLKPKYIELIAGRLLQEECISIESNKGTITDPEKFKTVLEQIPPKFEDAFSSNFRHLLSVYPLWEKEFKDILSCVYFLNILSHRMIELFNLSKKAILVLCKHDIIKESESFSEDAYVFEHDLVEMTISKKIYPDLMEYAITFIFKQADIYQSALKDQHEQFVLCKLFCNNISKNELISIYTQKDRMTINHKFIYKFYFYFMNNLIRLKEAFLPIDFIRYMSDCCKYVRDKVSEIQAEKLFELAHAHLRDFPRESKEMMALYFSFMIHFCENKIRLAKASECLELYCDYYGEIEKSRVKYPDLTTECEYAKAYLNNRIFVCGKLENESKKNLSNWIVSVKAAQKYHFWDIQFENYFDLANIYLDDNKNTKKALFNLGRGFYYFEKLNNDLQQKFSVNYYSKKILYFLLKQDYNSSLSMIKKALLELKENTYINYHIFFRQKYKKYEIINLMLLEDYTSRLDKCMEEYEQLLSLTGHLKNNFEWIFLQAKYAFYIGNNLNFENFVKKGYSELCMMTGYNTSKEYVMLKELALKYRQTHDICDFLNERAAGLSDINYILKMDKDSFLQFYAEYKSAAPVTSKDNKEGYYL